MIHWHIVHRMPRRGVFDRISPAFPTEESAQAGLRRYNGGGPGIIRFVEETTEGQCWNGSNEWVDFAEPVLPKSLGNDVVRVSHA